MEVNKTTIDNNQEEIRLRLDDYLEFDELISPTEFANTVGIDPSGFIKMLKGQMKITLATLKKISDATGLRLEWLILGIEPQRNDPTPKISYTEGVPYYDEDFLLGFDEIGTPSSENPDFLIRMPGYEKATLWCNASGHSMEPATSSPCSASRTSRSCPSATSTASSQQTVCAPSSASDVQAARGTTASFPLTRNTTNRKYQ